MNFRDASCCFWCDRIATRGNTTLVALLSSPPSCQLHDPDRVAFLRAVEDSRWRRNGYPAPQDSWRAVRAAHDPQPPNADWMMF